MRAGGGAFPSIPASPVSFLEAVMTGMRAEPMSSLAARVAVAVAIQVHNHGSITDRDLPEDRLRWSTAT
jgi:hypothetical protein